MPRYIRNTVVLAKVETTAGTDAVPTGAADAVLVSNMSITPLDAKMIDRNNIRGYFGANDQLVGPASVKVSYEVELAGSGTAGTPPQWGDLLIGCAFAEGILATPTRVEYTPISTALKTLSKQYYDDGVQHKVLGAMGDFSITAKVSDNAGFKFDFTGLDGGAAVVANPGATLTAWKAPVPMMKANVIDITLGGTYALGVVTGGTLYSSTGIDIKCGNVINFTPLLGSETVDITNREVKGSIELDLTAAQEVALLTSLKAATQQTLAFTIGTAAGAKIIIFLAAAQLMNMKTVDLNGKRLIGFDIYAIPVTGNDELRIVCL